MVVLFARLLVYLFCVRSSSYTVVASSKCLSRGNCDVLLVCLFFFTFLQREKEGSKPGDLGFDPLRLHTFRSSFGLDKITENLTRQQKLDNAKKDMELCEIKNGRLAMIAMTGFAAQEFVTGISVVEQTPFFFGDPIM